MPLQDRDHSLVSKLARNAIDKFIELGYVDHIRPTFVGVADVVIGTDMDGADTAVVFVHDAAPDATPLQRYVRSHVDKMLGGDVMVEVITEW